MRFWYAIHRVAHILTVLTRHAWALAGTTAAGRVRVLAPLFRAHSLSGPERLRVLIEDLGGTFIKFGQMLALQPDVLALPYCNALFDLLDRIAPFGFDDVERTFEQEFGRGTAELFDAIDHRPIATASIGQVYVAHLGGRKLAVKVQRPSVKVDFQGDIRLMTFAIRAIKFLRLKRLNWMTEPMSEFAAWTREELDYRHEADYMRRLRANAASNSREYVPETIDRLTTSRILTLEFLDGTTVLAYLRASVAQDRFTLQRVLASGFDPDRFACNVIENFLGDAFSHGIFHADLHPANLMVLHNNVVGYIDFGITGVLSAYSRRHLVAMTLAYTRGDLPALCSAFLKISAVDRRSSLADFREGLEQLSEQWYEISGNDRRLKKNFTLVMLDMLTLSRKVNVWPEREVIKFIRSAIAIDGLITRFAPGFDLRKHLETTCRRYGRFQTLQCLVSFDALASWASASERLLQSGPILASEGLGRLLGANHAVPPLRHASGASHRFVRVAAVAIVAAALLALTPADPGIRAFTSQAVLAGFISIALIRVVSLMGGHRGNHA